jgi:hypothetical protein
MGINPKVKTDEEVLGRPGKNLAWIILFYLVHLVFLWWIFIKDIEEDNGGVVSK